MMSTSGLSNGPKVVYLLPYADDGSIHGGKIRAAKIIEIIRKVTHDYEVYYLGDESYESSSAQNPLEDMSNHLVGDVQMLYRNFGLATLIRKNVDILIFEQPWVWNEVKRLKHMNPNLFLIYSSQNIEWNLKYEIMKKYVGNKTARNVGELIYDVEVEITKSVDLIVAVSHSDASWFRSQSSTEVIVATNGTAIPPAMVEMSQAKDFRFAVVIGSAHPPNIEGALHFLSDPELWFPKNTRLKIVGSLSSALRPYFGGLKNRWNQNFVDLAERVDDLALTEIIAQSSAILLPISYGGGTNLKTAEGLVSGKTVIGSRQSFRGYEKYMNLERVHVVDRAVDFKSYTIGALTQPQDNVFRPEAFELDWNETLRPLMEKLLGFCNE